MPALVITHFQIVRRRDQFNLVTRGIQSPISRRCGAIESVHTRFPECVEYRFVFLVRDGFHILHAAHIVYAVHFTPPDTARSSRDTPTMASRVTRAANSC